MQHDDKCFSEIKRIKILKKIFKRKKDGFRNENVHRVVLKSYDNQKAVKLQLFSV